MFPCLPPGRTWIRGRSAASVDSATHEVRLKEDPGAFVTGRAEVAREEPTGRLSDMAFGVLPGRGIDTAKCLDPGTRKVLVQSLY